ncbi:MAG: glycine cleavage system protein GcvH [Anaerolineaceae bacterium]|jgi:glycine cleavage system H protein
MNIPAELKYTKSDEWVKVAGNVATIGVTDYAQSQLSDIVFLEFSVEAENEIGKNDAIATLESVKAAADITSPVSGKVIELNESLTDKFELINSDPFGEAWIVKIELSDSSELSSLLDATAYEKYCEERSH